MRVLVATLEKERFGKTSRPQKVERPCKPGHVSAAKRRALVERDGEQCTYTDEEGNRCPETGLLEVDHIDPAGLLGSDELENLRMRCKAHNLAHAEDVYGVETIERRIAESRATKEKRDSEVRPHRGDEPAREASVVEDAVQVDAGKMKPR